MLQREWPNGQRGAAQRRGAAVKRRPFHISDPPLPDGLIVDLGLLPCGFQLKDDGAQSVVAAANRHARFADPVPVIKDLRARAVG